ncbi:kynureninase [Clostridium fermenticellae]|uniref:Kynureninase n=1 Tax=Clostridium fermenticellae TaxID=2068654 RepID=A0A386H4K2_9CLOT|nr:kynureninase [Clostridium fermenticellae]AYD40463.1 kynureninase [Clostridium fermenticellae]
MSKRKFELTLDYAKKMDQEDELKSFRDRFYVKEGQIFMDGNSLGLCSKDAENSLLNMLNVWKKEAINIWGTEDGKYLNYSEYLAGKIAPLLNADANEIAVVGSTTMNVHQAISTFYKPTKDRYKILVDDLNFPTDRYAVDSQIRLKGLKVEDALKVVKSKDGVMIDEDTVIDAMTDDVALVLLPSVLYRSSQLLDMKKITNAAKERGIYIGWDLCHSIGAISHDFKDIDPDFAIWCNYKYLSGGPGATAGLFINKKHFNKHAGLAGWFGNNDKTQFQLNHEFDQDKTAKGWQTGTPNLLSMAPIEGTLNMYKEAGMDKIRKKSLQITAYLMYLIDEKLSKYGFRVGNPREDEKRGGHVCLIHDDAYRINSALKNNGVIPDFREPNVIRLAPIALYTSYEDVYKLIEITEKIMENKEYENFTNERSVVV